ncbi:MAG: hypothetical protein J5965_17165 [Aeriscardovia sp.]|nr:hypothetical protein [Aeriscardovia sp.]
MSTFAIFNYQFDKIMEHARQGELKGMETVLMSADEAFPQKQKIFGEMLNKDFKKEKTVDVIHFTNGQGPKEYIHRHLMPPTDDIVIMRVANRKTQTIVDENLREKQVDDYQNCIVMIDNRPGIQRMLIENKKVAFRDVKSLANILEYTFNRLLRPYSLVISLDHLQNSRQFWQYAKDRHSYPKGFYRISFKLPYPNLERLRKVYDRLFSNAQKSFDSRLNMDFINPEGKVRLDENDPYQKEAIKWFMEEAGGDVTLYSNLAKKTPIHIGENSYRAITVSNTIIQKVTEDAVNNDLFGSSALDEVKRKLKTGIEP